MDGRYIESIIFAFNLALEIGQTEAMENIAKKVLQDTLSGGIKWEELNAIVSSKAPAQLKIMVLHGVFDHLTRAEQPDESEIAGGWNQPSFWYLLDNANLTEGADGLEKLGHQIAKKLIELKWIRDTEVTECTATWAFNKPGLHSYKNGFRVPNAELRNRLLCRLCLRRSEIPMTLRIAAGRALLSLSNEEVELPSYSYPDSHYLRTKRNMWDTDRRVRDMTEHPFWILATRLKDIQEIALIAGIRIVDYVVGLLERKPGDRTRAEKPVKDVSPRTELAVLASSSTTIAPWRPIEYSRAAKTSGHSLLTDYERSYFKDLAWEMMWGGTKTEGQRPLIHGLVEGKLPFLTEVNIYLLLRLIEITPFEGERVGVCDLNVITPTERMVGLLNEHPELTSLPHPIPDTVIRKIIIILGSKQDTESLKRIMNLDGLTPEQKQLLGGAVHAIENRDFAETHRARQDNTTELKLRLAALGIPHCVNALEGPERTEEVESHASAVRRIAKHHPSCTKTKPRALKCGGHGTK